MPEPISGAELGKLADEYADVKAKRLAADKVAAALKSQETALSMRIIEQMQLQELTAIGGSTIRLMLPVEPDYVPHVVDWPVYYNHILEQNDFSLLERRPSRAALKERWEAGVDVPGVEKFPVFKLSESKVKG